MCGSQVRMAAVTADGDCEQEELELPRAARAQLAWLGLMLGLVLGLVLGFVLRLVLGLVIGLVLGLVLGFMVKLRVGVRVGVRRRRHRSPSASSERLTMTMTAVWRERQTLLTRRQHTRLRIAAWPSSRASTIQTKRRRPSERVNVPQLPATAVAANPSGYCLVD